MADSPNVDPTLCNTYANQDQEYIFCSKGRPFGCLVSPYLPTPTATLIDYALVRDVGMKMSDLQYTKLSYAGNKFRILGKVCVTVQTIHGGLASGNFNLKASVVLDLHKTLDIESVAGVKMTKQLTRNDSLNTSSSSAPCLGAEDISSCSTSQASSPPRSPPPAPAARPPAPRTAPRSPPTRPRSRSPPPRPSSPPGFPVQPQYRNTVTKPQQLPSRPPEIQVSMTTIANPTARSCNLHSLEETFFNADIMPDVNKELRALHEADPDGRVTVSEDQVMTFMTTGGLRYEFGHGRNRCRPEKCKDRSQNMATVPHNCAWHKQWLIPYGFIICGPHCRAAFCGCVNQY